MRRYKPEDFEAELLRRGCTKIEGESDVNGTYWRYKGKAFQVPNPDRSNPGDPRYDDFILDDLLQMHGLPAQPN